MKPVIAIVGRPNVGKSTLFNRLTRSRDAIVADFAGLTRDRHYGRGRVGEKPFLVVDTGGLEPVAKDGILHHMAASFRAKNFHERRFHQKEVFYRLPGRPFIKFFLLYVLKRGFLDGRAGLTYATLQSIYEYFIVLKTRELERARD